MGQGLSSQGEKQESQNQREGYTKHQPQHGFFHFDFPFEGCDDRYNSQNEVNGVVVEQFSSHFSAEIAQVGLSKQTNAVAMEVETDETIINVPFQDRQDQIEGNKQGAIKRPGFERLPVKNEYVEHHSHPKEYTGIFG